MLILIFLLSLYLAFFLHELGHFWAARRFGVNPDTLMVGAPPWLFKGKVFDLPLRIGLLPLGGWVAMEIEELNRLKPLQVATIFLAGPLVSLLVGLATFLPLSWDPEATQRLVRLGEVLLYIDLIGETNQKESLALAKELLQEFSLPQAFLLFFGAVNLASGFLSLLPLPPMDGGGALFFWLARFSWGKGFFLLLTALTLALFLGLFAWLVILDKSRKPPTSSPVYLEELDPGRCPAGPCKGYLRSYSSP